MYITFENVKTILPTHMLQKEVAGHSRLTSELDLFEIYYDRGQGSQYLVQNIKSTLLSRILTVSDYLF